MADEIIIAPNESLPTNLDDKSPVQKRGRALALFDDPIDEHIKQSLKTSRICREVNIVYYGYNNIRLAKQIRDEHLTLFAAADEAMLPLYLALTARLKRDVAAAMVGAMLGGFRTKPDKHALAAMLDMLEGDEIAGICKMWEPLQASPAALALGCRKLIATATFPPQPSELYAAVREGRNVLAGALHACENVVEFVHIADATLLEFAPREEWLAPWHDRHELERMLHWHESLGDNQERKCCDADGKLTAFGALVKREQAALAALPAPKPPKRIAAARKRSEAKHMIQV